MPDDPDDKDPPDEGSHDTMFDRMTDEQLAEYTSRLPDCADPCINCNGMGRVTAPDSVIRVLCMACLGTGTNWRMNGTSN